MTQIMTATEMTDGQIESAVNKLRDAMRKHRSNITSDVAQQVLGVENLGMMMFGPFRERAEAVSNLIVRKVPVNRSRSPQEALVATNRRSHMDRDVVDAMPKASADEAEIVFFKPKSWEYSSYGWMNHDDIEKAFDRRNLKPADPISVAAVNEADPAFADEKFHYTYWQDSKGNWCYAEFGCWDGGRGVCVECDIHGLLLPDHWWLAGVRK